MTYQFKKLLPVTIAVTGFLMTKCSLFEHNIDGDLSTYFSINEQKNEANIQYSTVNFIDASSDEDISKNMDKIKDWSVTEISYKVWGFSGDPSTTISGDLGFSRQTESAPSVKATFSNIMLNSITDDDIKYKVNLSETQLATIADYFKEDQVVKVFIDGILSQGPVYFDLEIFIKVKVTAKL